MIKTIIIEDEARSREILHSTLLNYCNDVEVLAVRQVVQKDQHEQGVIHA